MDPVVTPPVSEPQSRTLASRSNPAVAAVARVLPRGERLRWGLTGLAAVFLVVMVAAAGLRPTGREAKPGTGEPLAVLGVAPGPATRPADEQ
jgi:hypothetical protein